MKLKGIIFLFFIFTPLILFSQDCKFDFEKKDQKTNQVFRSVTLPIGLESMDWRLTLEQRGQHYYISIFIKWGDKYKDSILEGQKISFTLEDGNKVFLIATKDYPPSHVVDNDGEKITTYYPRGELKGPALEMLSKSAIVKIRLKMDGDVKEITKIYIKQTDKIMKAASCLLQTP